MRSLLTVNGEECRPPPGAKKINGFVHGRQMMTSLLRRDCRQMARREIRRRRYSLHLEVRCDFHLRCSRRLAALRDCLHRCNHRRSERCAEEEESKSLLRVESRRAAAY